MEARISNFENFYFFTKIHCTSMNIGMLPKTKLLCQQVAIITMQLDQISIHIPCLISIERVLGWEPGPRTSKISTF